MRLPIKYKIYDGKLWVRWGIEDVWKMVRRTSAKRITPITQNFGNDFIWTKRTPVEWRGRLFYKEIIGTDGHNGIDFEAPSGTRLYAPHDGEITEIMNRDNKGIRLTGDEYSSVFYHLQDFCCNLNQKVKQGDLIGMTDNTGRYTTAPHLHWGVRPINYQNDSHGGYIDFRAFIEDLDVEEMPYEDGQCLLVKPDGQFYVVENGDLVYYDSDKQPDRHIPIVDFFIKQNKKGLPPNFIQAITKREFNKYNYLIK